jgi:hypothetical protein
MHFSILKVSTRNYFLAEKWGMTANVFAFGAVADFTTNVDAENQTLINHKTVCGALNRHFCQTAVMPSLFFFCCGLSVNCCCLWCGCKNTKVPPKALAILTLSSPPKQKACNADN